MKVSTKKGGVLVAAAVAFGAMGGAALDSVVLSPDPAMAAGSTAAASGLTDPTQGELLSTAFSDLAEQVTPAVVRIEVRTAGEVARSTGNRPMQIPEPFRQFFDMPDMPRAPQGPRVGGGSGYLISDDGYIITNNHVVEGADQIEVTLHDRRSFPAEVVGTDPTTDVAVIRIDAADLPHLEWGNSSELRVGAWIMAIGNPGFGGSQLDYTVTTGIVSAMGRPLSLIGRGLQSDPRFGAELSGYAIENFIQTDAVINPGNSGGPMVDMRGRVVGMNTAIASTNGQYQGYGFAVPSDLVRRVAMDLMDDGVVERAWLGIQMTPVTPEDAEAFGLPSVSGVVVQAVTEDGPAEGADLRQGDVIVSVDGRDVVSAGSLQEMIATRQPGDDVTVGFYRDGRAEETRIRLGEAPVNGALSAPRSDAREGRGEAVGRLGLTLQPLTGPLAGQLGFEEEGGLVVSGVDPMGPAASRGITNGLRLEQIDDVTVRANGDVEKALSGKESGEVVTLRVRSPGGDLRIVNVRLR